jgi:hypothetical protein
MKKALFLPRRRHGQMLVAALLALATGASQALSFSQGTFNASDWAQHTQTDTGPGVLTAAVAEGSGNPGEYWELIYQVPATTSTSSSENRLAVIYQGAAYEPGVSGALQSLDFSLDVRGLSTSFSFAQLGYLRPAILQDGIVYTVASSDHAVLLGGQYQTVNWSFSASDVWVSAGTAQLPDFSSSGSTIYAGFRFAHFTSCSGINGCRGGSTFSGVDKVSFNLQAAAAPVPEPSSLALLLAGLGCVAWRVRTHRAWQPRRD